eukprot:1614668-Rhodomonas_salina.1
MVLPDGFVRSTTVLEAGWGGGEPSLSCYACAMRFPERGALIRRRWLSRIILRACYAMSGTDIAYGDCYGVCGTNLGQLWWPGYQEDQLHAEIDALLAAQAFLSAIFGAYMDHVMIKIRIMLALTEPVPYQEA